MKITPLTKPLPQVLYLDSAHIAGEVLLELELAWQLLPKGGILVGDDWFLDEVIFSESELSWQGICVTRAIRNEYCNLQKG